VSTWCRVLKRSRKHRAGTAAYSTGRERIETILDAAQRVFVADGYARFTMRRIAAAAGISVGNLSYYYATKQDLVADLLDWVIAPYLAQFEALREIEGATPEAQLREVLSVVVNDLATRETTLFFPELWALANRDRHAARQMEGMYDRYRGVVAELAGLVNPSLSVERARELALFITSAIEGLTVFVGHRRPHADDMPAMRELAVETFVATVKKG